MGALLDRLATATPLVSDGAWGTMLQAEGLEPNDCPEEWNLSHADTVKGIAAAYVAAGSDLILTNSFGGSRCKLAKMGFADRVADFNRAAAENSRAVAGEALVAGSVGPTGEFLEPLGTMSEDELGAIFTEQIGALLAGGVQVVCVETMTALEEAACAVRAAKALDPAIDVIATMTFDRAPTGYHTMMGVSPAQAVEGLSAAGADVVGANCGNGIVQMIDIVTAMRAITTAPILVHANAGMPELIAGQTVFRQSPEDMAARVDELVAAGATIVGGCCGTTPGHIAAIKERLAPTA